MSTKGLYIFFNLVYAKAFTCTLTILLIFVMIACNDNRNQDTVNISLKVMSYNIRLNTQSDIPSGNGWDDRKHWLAGLIRYHEPAIFGLQEVLLNQLEFIQEKFPDYTYSGLGRDDGETGGEFSPVFYNSKMFELLDEGTFWLSETPEIPSKGWDADINRIVSWVKLKHISSGKFFFFLNTHFDHIGVEARKNSARLIIDKVNEIAADVPFILTGDFNVPDDSEPYNLLASAFNDAKVVSQHGHYGPKGSWSTFSVCGDTKLDRRIDFIFVHDDIKVIKHAILSDSKDGRYPSDHLPVVAEITLE